MKIVVFKGGLGNQLFQYAFYKYLSRKDETFYFYNDAWYNVCLLYTSPSPRDA